MNRPNIKDFFSEDYTPQMINNTFLENKELYNYIQAQDNYIDDLSNRLEKLVMPKIAGIVWEQRYSKTLDNDKFGRWMRIGRINEMTVAIITKAEVENKPTRYVVRLPNNTGNESLQNDIITLSENEAMLEAEKYIAKYVSNFTA